MPTDAEVIPGSNGTLRARIRAKTRRRHRDACWEWTGQYRQHRGAKRPYIVVGGRGSKKITVARVVLALFDRVPLSVRVEEGAEAGHQCHHAWCVNRRHLRWVSREVNEEQKEEFDDEFDRFSAAIDERAAQAYGGGR